MRAWTDRPGRRLVDNARLYAMLAMAGDDAGVAITVAKLIHYAWWPITAIRAAADDGNPATAAEAAEAMGRATGRMALTKFAPLLR